MINIQKILFHIFIITIFIYFLLYAVTQNLIKNGTQESEKLTDYKSIFEKRRKIKDFGCKMIQKISDIRNSDASFQDLLNFHENIYNLNYEFMEESEEKCRQAKRTSSNLFRTRDWNLKFHEFR